MKPAPPVTRTFLVSGFGSNFVVPLSTGASFQMPLSSNFAAKEPRDPVSDTIDEKLVCHVGASFKLSRTKNGHWVVRRGE